MDNTKMYLDNEGYRCYRQSLLLVLVCAINRIMPNAVYDIHQSVNRSTYVEFLDNRITERDIAALKNQMQELIHEKHPLSTISVKKEKAAELFCGFGNASFGSKILNTPRDEVTLFEDSGKYYSVYGKVTPDASHLTEFDLKPFESGFLLRYPHPGYDGFPPFSWGKKIIMTIDEYRRWNEITGIADVFNLNREISAGHTAEIVNIAEILHEKAISSISDSIKHDILSRKIVLIAGPSSSGKTTFANRLMLHLRANGITPLVISLDDYFLDADKSPLDENGKPDFETIASLDVELFSSQLSELVAGKTVNVPRFDFRTGKRSALTRKMTLDASSVVIVEGIHALNERLTNGIHESCLFRIYCSCLTSLCFDNVNPISPTDTRLLRRIIRDSQFRNCEAARTFELWKNVSRGEIVNIFPYEDNVDVIFNSSNIYELSYYKPLAVKLLTEANEKDGDHHETCSRLLELLSYFEPINGKYVPPMSITREFMGGSSIKY